VGECAREYDRELVANDTKLRMEAAVRLMAAGVTIYMPETCVIDAEVEVAADTVIEPFVQLLGRTRIGEKCLIRSFTVIENCALGNNVLVRQSCVLTDSTVAMGQRSGPSRICGPKARSAKTRTWATLWRQKRRSWAREPRPAT